MAKRDDLVNAYIAALDLRAVLILAGPNGRSGVCIGPSPNQIPTETLWFSKLQHAELVMAQCPEGWCSRSPAELRDVVINAAAALGAPWRTAAEVEAEAEVAVDDVERQVEALKYAGALKRLNSGYKTYRLAMQATCALAIQYGDYIHGFKVQMVALIGKNVAAGAGRYDGVLALITSPDSSMAEAMRDAKRAYAKFKNVAKEPVEQLHYSPPHHTRNAVHRSRKLKV